MAITKMMHMKASNKARIDIHLEHSINYILQPKKLGEANLTGGINCLPEMAYRQMKATKQLFGKTGGRQGYHFVISLKPGEGTPEIMYDIAMRFAKEAFAGEYEAVVAVHTDREHLHAHIVINSVNMVTGYKFQCRDGDWKYKFQPITNKLCEEYGLHITPAEYSKEPKNMARPQWEREQAFSKWIKQDALFCAISAENMEHFVFLLEKLGFDVKQGKHIAVKVPGMKRFKRLDTISEDLTRESLEAMFRYGDASLASPVNRTVSLLPVRKAVLTPYQRKCYARMYRLRLAEKKRFTYKSAYLYEQIRKMHELQEEYLVVVRYDVKSYGDLFRLKQRLQQVDEELCKAQKEMYRDRTLQKRSCKTAEDLEFFEASEDDYRERLEQIKLQKKDNRKKLKAVERCLERDGSLTEAELEMRIPVGDMEDMAEVVEDNVPENPYRVPEVVEVEKNTFDMMKAVVNEIYSFAKLGKYQGEKDKYIVEGLLDIQADPMIKEEYELGDLTDYKRAANRLQNVVIHRDGFSNENDDWYRNYFVAKGIEYSIIEVRKNVSSKLILLQDDKVMNPAMGYCVYNNNKGYLVTTDMKNKKGSPNPILVEKKCGNVSMAHILTQIHYLSQLHVGSTHKMRLPITTGYADKICKNRDFVPEGKMDDRLFFL